MFKSMSIYERDNKRIVKSNFVTSCLAFGAQSQHFQDKTKWYLLVKVSMAKYNFFPLMLGGDTYACQVSLFDDN